MMTSLFSSFDPMSMIIQLNWITIITPLLILPKLFWVKSSRSNLILKKMEEFIIKEMSSITKKKEMMIFSTSFFLSILLFNFMGLFPYVFTPTSHICISMSLALPVWLMIMIFGWLNLTNKMFIHLLPSGTPTMIMPMMIIIETTGNLIRPISLSVWLSANMIAGHLLMTLLGDVNNINTIMMILPIQMLLMTFEAVIAIIQAYVFCTLMNLYSSEISYEKKITPFT